MGSHAAVAAELLEDRGIVDLVLEDHLSPEVPEDWRALFTLVMKVNGAAAKVSEADIDAARSAGWNEEAIYDAITTCALFNFFNAWVDGAGVPGLTAEAYRESARRMAWGSYA